LPGYASLPWSHIGQNPSQAYGGRSCFAAEKSKIIDLFARQVIGWAMSNRNNAELMQDALTNAI